MSPPLFDERAVEAGAKAIHSGKGCTCRRGARGDAADVLAAAVAVLNHDRLVHTIMAAMGAEEFAADDLLHPSLRAAGLRQREVDARRILAALGLIDGATP